MNWDTGLWLAAIVVFLIAEGASVMVISLWFAIGSLVAMVASLFGADFWLQVVLFVVVSSALLLALRPLTKKFFNPRLVATNVDAVIGALGIVTEKIDNVHGMGRVKLENMEWAARSAEDTVLEAGSRVRVTRVEGVKVYVEAVAAAEEKQEA